jgi:soluble lytic murein transglycosylase-like protein
MAITRFLGCNAVVAVAICGAVSGCSSVQSASKTDGATPADVAVADPSAAKVAGEGQLASAPAAKTARLSTTEVAALTGPVAVPAGMTTAVLEKGTRVHVLALPTGTAALQAQNQSVMASLQTNDAPVATPALAVAPTSVAQTGALQAIDMATARTVTRPTNAAQSLSAPTLASAPKALPEDVTAPFAAIPTPRPRIAASTPSSMVAYAGPSQPVSVMSSDFFPPAPGGPIARKADTSSPELNKLIKRYAGLYGVPESLVHRVVHRESRYDPKAYNKRGFFGLMQIKYSTAKSMGYDGPASGLLDAETNLRYAIKYLRGAWLVADNDSDGAVKNYARGYYYDAKKKNMLHVLK